jgi:xanthine dehydrogenase/oxidase
MASPVVPATDRAPLAALTSEWDDTVRFFLNGTRVVLDQVDPEATLLEYLRGIGLTGTKLGCGEGGCGACTVVISQHNPTTGKLYHASVNACLAPLASVDGKHVITVEGIGSTASPHAVQARMARGNGSQCGFCTPGIVMSLYALVRNNPAPSEEEVEEAFDGNLCRCTGYRSILDVAQTFGAAAAAGGEGCGGEGAGGGGGVRDGCCMGSAKGSGGCCMDQKNGADEEAPARKYTPPDFVKYDPNTELIFPPSLKSHKFAPLAFGNKRKTWYRPVTLEQLLQLKGAFPAAKLIGGSTETQIETKFKALHYPVSVFVGDVVELRQFELQEDAVEFGGNVVLTDVEGICDLALKKYGPRRGEVFAAMRKQLRYFAGRQIRNVGTPAGNLATASPISDLNPVLLAAGAVLVAKSSIKETEIPMDQFFKGYRRTALPADAVIASIRVPVPPAATREHFRAYKQAKRKDDDIAIVTAALRVRLDADGVVEDVCLAYGGMAPMTVAATGTHEFLRDKRFAELATLEGAMDALARDFDLQFGVPGGMATYRKSLALGFFYRFYHDVLGAESVSEDTAGSSSSSSPGIQGSPSSSSSDPASSSTSSLFAPPPSTSSPSLRDAAAVGEIEREISSGAVDDATALDYEQAVVGKSFNHAAALKQVCGEAQYTDDSPPLRNELHGCFVLSTRPHARLVSIDYSAALAMPGVVDKVDRADMSSPEANRWGAPFNDEVFFAEDEVYTTGQVIGLVLATSAARAAEAARAVKIEYEDLPAILTIEEAIAQNSFYPHFREIKKGNVQAAFDDAGNRVFSGVARMGGQEHFYLETQACLVVPKLEGGELEVFASSQNANETQAYAAQVTGVPANRITVRIKRLGGGFGGKETRSVPLSSILALAAHKTRRPVRYMLTREEDMVTSGQRHPFLGRWKVAVNKEGKIQALDLDLFNNAGWSSDLSAAVMERALTHADGCYLIPNIHVRGRCCRTNTMSNTAFRGFGGPQGMFVAETWMEEVADHLGMPVERLREINFYKDDDLTHFNNKLDDWHVPLMWKQLRNDVSYDARRLAVDEFNATSRWRKRGLALIPTKFGISFSVLFLNQAGALVHIYHDGSVLVAHGGIEMGQGLHTKMTQIAAEALRVPLDSVFISETSTATVANASSTAASASSDLNGYAIFNACAQLNERLAPYREKLGPDATMKQLAHAAYFDRVNLSAQGFYKTPEIGYSWEENKGRMFFYFTQGVAAAEVEVDTLTGSWTCARADVLMDVGRTINPAVDYGQIQGAFVQGMGLFTMEESLWLRNGAGAGNLFTRGPGAYKIPGFRDVPQVFNVSLLKGVEWKNLRTIQRSRGVGEPPLFMGSSVFFAVRDALKAARRGEGKMRKEEEEKKKEGEVGDGRDEGEVLHLESPATTERIRLACTDSIVERARVQPKDGEKSWFVAI